MTSPLFTVVAAMPEEIAPLQRRLLDARRVATRPARISRGRLGGRDVALVVTGDGPTRARAGMEAVLGCLRVDFLLGVGVAGGVSAGLAAGDLVWAEEVRREGGVALRAPAAPTGIATGALAGLRTGAVVTADRIVDSLEAKQRMGRPTPTRPARWSIPNRPTTRLPPRRSGSPGPSCAR